MSLLLFFFLLLYSCNLALNGDVVVGSVWQMGEIRVLIFWLEEQEGRPQCLYKKNWTNGKAMTFPRPLRKLVLQDKLPPGNLKTCESRRSH